MSDRERDFYAWSDRPGRERKGRHQLKRKLLLVLVAGLASAAQHDWKTAKVLDAKTAKTYVDADGVAIRDYQLAILSEEFAYIISDTQTPRPPDGIHLGHIIAARHHGCRFIVGDEVRFYQQKDVIHVIDADGKECKTEVLRQERLPKRPSPTSAAGAAI